MKAFIFDMDGVLLDSEPLHFASDMKTMRHFGIEITREELEEFVGMVDREMLRTLKQRYNAPHSVAEMMEYQRNAKVASLMASDIGPIDGIRELLAELEAHHIRLAVASSSPRRLIDASLAKLAITPYFEITLSGEEVAQGKPAPDIYLEVARQLDVTPGECVVLEDSGAGVKAAKSANMKCIGFLNPSSGNQDLSGADLVVRSIREISMKDLLS